VIRLAWLQARVPMLAVAGGLVAVAALLAVTGPHLAGLYSSTITRCAARGDCSIAKATFLQNDASLRGGLGYLVLVVPAVLGVFWGAPLVARELESGTHRLAWTQSVTRTRWLAVKLGLAAAGAVVATGLLSLMVTWWELPFDRVLRDQYRFFDQRGVVPIAYAVFAIALGVTCGLVLRRLLAAMAATLLGFGIAVVADTSWLRTHLFAPARTTMPLDFGGNVGFEMNRAGVSLHQLPPSLPNALVTASHIVNRSGTVATSTAVNRSIHQACSDLAAGPRHAGPPSQAALQHCIAQLSTHYRVAVSYQPAGRYWVLQATETTVFLSAGILLAGFCFWWLRHRVV
jgi:hypothetical protein